MPRTLLVVVVALLSLGACARLRGIGAGDSAPYLTTQICGVQIDGRTKTTHLRLVLRALRPLPANATLEVEFQNPADEARTLVVRRRLTGDEQTIEVLSPPLTSLRSRNYHVAARVYATAGGTQVIATHSVRCESLVDDRDLP